MIFSVLLNCSYEDEDNRKTILLLSYLAYEEFRIGILVPEKQGQTVNLSDVIYKGDRHMDIQIRHQREKRQKTKFQISKTKHIICSLYVR